MKLYQAFDDQTSTFIIPSGGGFEIVFCPRGRSSNILDVLGDELRQVAATGHVSEDLVQRLANGSFSSSPKKSAGSYARSAMDSLPLAATLGVATLVGYAVLTLSA